MSSSDTAKQAAEWLKSTSVGFLGCGNMAQAMIHGFVGADAVPAANIVVSATSETSKNYRVCQEIGVRCTTTNAEVASSKIVFIAVKPHLVRSVMAACEFAADTMLISVAAGVRLDALTEVAKSQRVIRAMPNTGCRVRQGVTVFSYPKGTFSPVEEAAVEQLMQCLGFCQYVSESQIEPISAVSGSGIAFMYMALEAMSDGAVKAGIPRALSYQLAAQTMKGAAAMVMETGDHPGQLKDAVCSPGGSTIAGVHALEKAGFRSAMMDGVEAAFDRVRQLG